MYRMLHTPHVFRSKILEELFLLFSSLQKHSVLNMFCSPTLLSLMKSTHHRFSVHAIARRHKMRRFLRTNNRASQLQMPILQMRGPQVGRGGREADEVPLLRRAAPSDGFQRQAARQTRKSRERKPGFVRRRLLDGRIGHQRRGGGSGRGAG